MADYKGNDHEKHENDNHSRQLDHEHDAFWQSRGYEDRPNDWQDILNDV